MVAAIRQMVKVEANGRIEILAPEFRAGTVMEVIVLVPVEPSPSTPADRVAALANMRQSIGLTSAAAEDWVNETRAERTSWNPSSAS